MRTRAEHIHGYANTGFNYTIEHVGDITNVHLKGSLDVRRVSTFTRDITACGADGMQQVVFDCGELKWIDHAGISAIVSLFLRSRIFNGKVKIARLLGQPRDIFQLLHLDKVLEIYPELESAYGSFAAHGAA